MKNDLFICLFIYLLLASCSKTDGVIDLEKPLTVTSKTIYRTTDQMAKLSFGQNEVKSDVSYDKIAVFPLKINSEETEVYAVVNYTDSTTLLTTKYVNYPANVLGFFEKMVIDSVSCSIGELPPILEFMLSNINSNIKDFSSDNELVHSPVGYIETRADDDFRPPAGCRVEIENNGTYSKINESYGPLLSTTWDQGSPYNFSVPSGIAVGCVAVAIGQLMRYHQYPVSLPNLNNISYVNMPNKYDIFDNNTELGIKSYVAPFLYKIGVLVGIRYEDGETGTSMANDGKDLIDDYYNVSKVNVGNRFELSHIERCRQSCSNRNPIIIRAKYNLKDGHAWLIDGYEDISRIESQIYRYYDVNNNLLHTQYLENPIAAFNFFHHNLGWGGRENCWLNVHASMYFGSKTYDRGIDLYYISK